MKAPAVHTVTVDVDIKATQTKENDSDEYKQEIQYRPVSSVPMGEVKRTSIATFPCSDELPSADDLPLGDLGRIEHPDQVLAVERGCTRTPPLVPVEKTATTKTGSPYQRGSCPTQQGAARAQPKRSRQYRNHERRHWPAGLGKGEVKQSKTGSFPPAFNLLDNGLPSDDHESVAPDHVQILERKDSVSIVPSVIKIKQGKRKTLQKSVKFASDIEENWGSAPPNQQRVYSRLEKNFDDTTVQFLSLAGGGGPSAGKIVPTGRSLNEDRGLSFARGPRDGLMGVIEVASGEVWPMAEKESERGVNKLSAVTNGIGVSGACRTDTEKETDLGASKKQVDTIDTGSEYDALDGSETVLGWESTMVDSLLNKHRPGSSWMKKKRHKAPRGKLIWVDDGQ